MYATNSVEAITAECLVQEIVERHPQTIVVFNRYGLQCVGCYISPFHTIADTAREYSLALESLLLHLNQAIATDTHQVQL
jgi:hybrid cluster-associated redox disulfide protein